MHGERSLRVLFAPETFNLGETSRAVEVAREVKALGHEVAFMGYSTRFADFVRDAGFGLTLLEPRLSEAQADQLIAVDQGRGIRHPFTADVIRRRVASELALFAEWRPDCAVIGTTLSLFISARAASLPLVYVRPYAMSRGHLTQMTSFPLTQGQGRLGRSVNRVAGRLIAAAAPRIRWKPAAFRKVAEEYRVHLPAATVDALDADLNLIASRPPGSEGRSAASEERRGAAFVGGGVAAAAEKFVGPIFARADGDLDEGITALADSRRPVVYVGLGSSAGRRLALDILHSIEALDVDVITSAGRYLGTEDRASLGDNVHVYDFLAAHRLAGIIDASVIHSGEGTVQTACASGVPFAGIGLQSEQRINLDECVAYGNAIRFTARDLRRGRLPEIVAQLLTDPRMRRAAKPLPQTNGASAAAQEIVRRVRAK